MYKMEVDGYPYITVDSEESYVTPSDVLPEPMTPEKKHCPPTPQKTPASSRREIVFNPPPLDFDDEETDGTQRPGLVMEDLDEKHMVRTPGKSIFSISSRRGARSCPRPRHRSRVRVNPFTPARPVDTVEEEEDYEMTYTSSTSRYTEDFEELEEIGNGSFGEVKKCRKRLDGVVYAVKRVRRKLYGKLRMEKMKEVYALAALDNPHIIRYYSAWIEDDELYVQTELCEAGTLYDLLMKRIHFPENELKSILYQVLDGLACMHALSLVHLDIKNENLYACRCGVYKIGDLGHIISFLDARFTPEDGDSRYLCRELLDDHVDRELLPKADIFSLGASLYELATRKPLPGNGYEWHSIRNGILEPLKDYSSEFRELLRSMMHPDPGRRPSAIGILQSRYLRSAAAPPDINEVATLQRRVWALEAELLTLQCQMSRVQNVEESNL